MKLPEYWSKSPRLAVLFLSSLGHKWQSCWQDSPGSLRSTEVTNFVADSRTNDLLLLMLVKNGIPHHRSQLRWTKAFKTTKDDLWNVVRKPREVTVRKWLGNKAALMAASVDWAEHQYTSVREWEKCRVTSVVAEYNQNRVEVDLCDCADTFFFWTEYSGWSSHEFRWWRPGEVQFVVEA